jgi:uncharacterized protein (DUF1800 family)
MRLRTLLLLLAALPSEHLAAQPGLPTARDSAIHALDRLAFGATPGLVERVAREGVMRWIDRQLAVADIDDPGLRGVLARFELLRTPPEELVRSYLELQRDRRADRRAATPDSGMQGMTPAERERRMDPAAREFRGLLTQAPQLVVVRAVGSDHQLAEVMADFWSNHFNIFMGKQLARVYLPSYIEETIRPRVFGRFEELLTATARSPAMLVYLDNAQSIMPGASPPALRRPVRRRGGPGGVMRARVDSMMDLAQQRRPSGLNENYARELMELHTLGVDGGYTQQDVTEVARVLTGWSVARPAQGSGYLFNAWAHDQGAKRVLGREFPAGGGEDEGLRLLTLLADHPATAHHVSAKLCARFVSDTPPDGCVDNAVSTWKRTRGDIREVLRTIFRSPDFWAPAHRAAKVKSPLEFVVSAVRAVGGAPDTTPRLAVVVGRLGQPIYQHAAPNGYPELEADWVNSGALLSRMNLAMQLAQDRLPGVRVNLDQLLPASDDHLALIDAVDRLVLSGRMSARTRAVIREQLAGVTSPVEARSLALGLALGGPEFQRQ